MPWYVFQTPQGQRQLFADTPQRAATIFFQKTGITANPIQGAAGDEPWAGIQFLGDGTGSTGSTGTGGGGNLPPDVLADLDEERQMSAFGSGMRQRGFDTEGNLGSFLRDQAAPAYANFSLAKSFGEGGTNVPDENAFSSYVANTGPNQYTNALNLYRQASTSPFGSPDFSDALNRARVGDDEGAQRNRANFMNVAQAAARARYSPAAAKFLPDRATLDRRFNQSLYDQGLQGENAPGVSLLNFLKRQYGF